MRISDWSSDVCSSELIKALEAELEVQLFRRKPRGVELTEAGESLLVDARRILGEVEAALAKAKRTARGEQGRVAVGFPASAPFHPFVTRVIPHLRAGHPLVALTQPAIPPCRARACQ